MSINCEIYNKSLHVIKCAFSQLNSNYIPQIEGFVTLCNILRMSLLCIVVQELSYQQRFGGITQQVPGQVLASQVPPIDVQSSSEFGHPAHAPPSRSILKRSIDFIDKMSPLPESKKTKTSCKMNKKQIRFKIN